MQSVEIQNLIQQLAKLPGLGRRSGRRIALHLLKKPEALLQPLVQSLQDAAAAIVTCEVCNSIDTTSPCAICVDPKRRTGQLCIVADVSDLWALERGNIFAGHYHVIGGILSAIDGVGPEDLAIDSLMQRLQAGEYAEVIFALCATVDGQTTMHFLSDMLKEFELKTSVLAHGLPIGGELDYLDDGTLTTAFAQRRAV